MKLTNNINEINNINNYIKKEQNFIEILLEIYKKLNKKKQKEEEKKKNSIIKELKDINGQSNDFNLNNNENKIKEELKKR